MDQNSDNPGNRLSDKQRALLHARLARRKAQGPTKTAIPKLRPEQRAQLSLAQERLWILHQLEPESTAYNVPMAIRLQGALDQRSLKAALFDVVQRHDTLRTTLQTEGDTRYQHVHASIDVAIQLEDLSELPQPERSLALNERLATQAEQLFALDRAPLFRAMLVKIEPQQHVLGFTAHHAVTDGWSQGIFLRDLAAAYEARLKGEEPSYNSLAVQYRDFACWQREWLAQGELDRQLTYWKRQLSGALPVLQLPLDHPRAAIRSHHGGLADRTFPPDLAQRLSELAAAHGATLFMVLLAAYKVLLHRYTGQEDLIVGTPVAGRTHRDTEPLIGLFANTLALRSDLSSEPSFVEFLLKVRATALEAYDHQDLPFQKLVEAIQPVRDMSRTPVYQTLFSFLDRSMTAPARSGELSFDRKRVAASIAQTDLVLYIEECEAGLRVSCEYATDLFDAQTVQCMVENFETLLTSIVNNPELSIRRLEMLGSTEHALMRTFGTGEACHGARDTCVHNLVERQVDATPNATALVFENQTLSFAELDARANQLAQRLSRDGVEGGDRVAVCLERSVEMVVALLGIQKAGAAYVPLDPNYPRERLIYMLEDCGAKIVVTTHDGARLLAVDAITHLMVDAEQQELARESPERVGANVGSRDLAYVIYTSGSTGHPKGVMVEHAQVVNFFLGMDDRVWRDHDTQGAWLAVTSISFDISVLEIFWTLSRGLKLVLYAADDRRSAAKQARRLRGSTSTRSIDFSLFYFASDEGEADSDKYRLLLEGAKFADRHGFEAVWTPERHFHPFGGLYPSPAVASAAIAVLTERVKIRAGSVVAPLDHYVRIAEEWQLVDNLSRGRVGISFAPGWQPNDFVLQPEHYAHRKQSMFESIDKIRALWRGERITLPGGDGKPFTFGTLPRPIQPELPYWVTAAGDPKTFAKAGELGANMLTHLLGQTVEELAQKLEIYRSAMREAGHSTPGIVTLMLHTFVGPDEQIVRQTVESPFKDYLRGSVGLFKPFAQALGLDFDNLTPEDLDALIDHAFGRYYRTNGLFGTPDTCVEMVDQLKEAGVDEIACLVDFGIPSQTVLEHLPYLDTLKIEANRTPAGTTRLPGDYSVPALIRRHEVTHLQCTPSMASMMVSDAEERESLRAIQHWMVGGEAFPMRLASQLRDTLSSEAHITNMYGPTETTIWSSTHELTGDETGSIPLGRPIVNTSLYVLDAHLRPVPRGVAGELVIGGEGVVRGYLNRQELTRERFVADPFCDADARMYRTGDLVRVRSDGCLEFLGRNDFQVKIRGYRIELGEIESCILSHPTISESVVVLREDTPGDKRLVAYVVPRAPGDLDTDALRDNLKSRLSDYMVPAAIHVLDQLPLTPNKKVDRKALPAPEAPTSSSARSVVKAETPLQEQIMGIWRGVLRSAEIGIHDNFFDLGGHSLLIVHVLNQLRSHGLKLAMTDLFRFPTIASLARFLTEGQGQTSAAVKQGSARAATRRAQRTGVGATSEAAVRRRRR